MSKAIFISVFIDKKLQTSCIENNSFIQNNSSIKIHSIDNSNDNQPISKRYNQFLSSYNYETPAWFVFCHSDWELCEDIHPLLEKLDTESIYGPIGAILCRNTDGSLIREYRGQCFERKRDGSNKRQQLCQLFQTGTLVDTLDCQCMIVHSSLVERYALRFDESLSFNLYVEDFCLSAKEKHGVKSRILNIHCCHWNQADSMEGRDDYFVDLEYCNSKYSENIYAGVVTLIGKGGKSSAELECESVTPQLIAANDSQDARSTIYQVPEVAPDAPNDSRSTLYRYVSRNSTVLDVGCACGDLGIALHHHKNCTVHGLEYNPESVLIAQSTNAYERVSQIDLNMLADNHHPEYAQKFDWIIFGDVLEHVYDPQEVLRKMLAYLAPGGRFLISLPNLAHASIKAELLLDEFTYTDVGLLDTTHIRFFTHKTIPAFLAKNLLKIEDFECTAANMWGFQPGDPYPYLSIPAKQTIFHDPHSFVCQYIMKVQHAPNDSFANCLKANSVLHTLDESRNPLLKTYREQAISIYAPTFGGGRRLLHSLPQRVSSAIGRSRHARKIRNILVKSLIAVLLLPASVIYAGGIKNWLREARKGRAFFSSVLKNQSSIASRTNSQNDTFHKIARKMLNRAVLLRDTDSLRAAFRGVRTALFGSSKAKDGIASTHTEATSEDALRYSSYIKRFEPSSERELSDINDEIQAWVNKPLLSLHVHADSGKLSQLQETITSVLKQCYAKWELLVTTSPALDAGSRKYLTDELGSDSRANIVQMDSAHALPENFALQECSGEFFIPLSSGDQLPQFSLYFVAKEALAHPNSRVIYSDTDVLIDGVRQKPFFKSGWNEELFLGQDYISRLVAYRTQQLKQIQGFRDEMKPCHIYDATLQLALLSDDTQIRHIPRVLYHFGHDDFCLFTGEQVEKSRQAVAAYLKKKGIDAIVHSQGNGTNRIEYVISEPLPAVSCIVAMRDKAAMTEDCISSILQKTDYSNLEIILVDNGSTEAESFALFESLQADNRVKVIHWDRPFNYSEIQNMAVKEARGEIVALLNNDIVVEDSQWLKEMVSHARKAHIGAVGTRLLFANDTLQHGGILLGPNGSVGHVFRDLPESVSKQKNIAQVTRWISAVTGACLVVDKRKYLEIGGLDECNLGIAFNDVDFCIRLALAGYQNLYTPHTKVYHLESASRGLDVDPAKKQRADKEQNYIIQNYADLLNSDPHYSPNLSFYGTNYDIIAPTEQARVTPLPPAALSRQAAVTELS